MTKFSWIDDVVGPLVLAVLFALIFLGCVLVVRATRLPAPQPAPLVQPIIPQPITLADVQAPRTRAADWLIVTQEPDGTWRLRIQHHEGVGGDTGKRPSAVR